MLVSPKFKPSVENEPYISFAKIRTNLVEINEKLFQLADRVPANSSDLTEMEAQESALYSAQADMINQVQLRPVHSLDDIKNALEIWSQLKAENEQIDASSEDQIIRHVLDNLKQTS